MTFRKRIFNDVFKIVSAFSIPEYCRALWLSNTVVDDSWETLC